MGTNNGRGPPPAHCRWARLIVRSFLTLPRVCPGCGAGRPIASGVVGGACPYVVKDCMEGSCMRWVMSGARAMIEMRCIYLGGLSEEFMAFRIQRESRRLYPGSTATDPDFQPAPGGVAGAEDGLHPLARAFATG